MNNPLDTQEKTTIRDTVRQKYGEIATTVVNGGAGCCGAGGYDAITHDLYDSIEKGSLPEAAVLASLGCGNPTALATLNAGETVLDLGSGGGIDVLLSAKRVGPTGFAYGLDMTDEMLELAEKNRQDAGAENVKFLRGHIEDIPLPDQAVDIIISNCVINLSADKDQVFREAFRVLKPGGRFAVSDVVTEAGLPDAVRLDMEAYVGCVAGALEVIDYRARLEAAGFVDVSIEPTRRYMFGDVGSQCCAAPAVESLTDDEKRDLDGKILSAFIRASKPN